MLFTLELQHTDCSSQDKMQEFTFSGYKWKQNIAPDTFIRSYFKFSLFTGPSLHTRTLAHQHRNIHFVKKRLLGHTCQWFMFPPDESRGELISKPYFSSFAGENPVDLRILHTFPSVELHSLPTVSSVLHSIPGNPRSYLLPLRASEKCAHIVVCLCASKSEKDTLNVLVLVLYQLFYAHEWTDTKKQLYVTLSGVCSPESFSVCYSFSSPA